MVRFQQEPSAPDCSTNVLKCVSPRVDFIGSSGQGASGSAIVNAVGNIIGVSINVRIWISRTTFTFFL